MSSGCQEPFEERAIPLERGAKIVGLYVISAVPLAFQVLPFVGEGLGEVLHELGDQGIGLLDGLTWGVDEGGLDVCPPCSVSL